MPSRKLLPLVLPLVIFVGSVFAQITPPPSGGGGGGTPGGANHDVQCNEAAAFGACNTGVLIDTTLVFANSPGAGVAHFAGGTQQATSSLIVTADITNANVTAAKLVNAGIYTGDVSGTFPATLVNQLHESVPATVNFAASPYTIAATDSSIVCDATGGPVTLNLPAATGTFREITVKKIDSGTQACIITRAGSDLIEGFTTARLTSQNYAVTVQDAASAVWYRIRNSGVTVLFGANTHDLNLFVGTFAPNCGLTTLCDGNEAVGLYSLVSVTTGEGNVAFGQSTLGALTTSNENTAIGSTALQTLTTGGGNTAIGGNSMSASATTAANNVAVGYRSLLAVTTGSNIVAVGEEALTAYTGAGTGVVAVGYQAGFAMTSGTLNTALGYRALAALTTSTNNVAVGDGALAALVSNFSNTAVGSGALAVVTASGDTCVGQGCGNAITTGGNNTCLGAGCLTSIVAGGSNVAVGPNAGPTANQANKLFIDITKRNDPLYGGDFSARTATVSGALLAFTGPNYQGTEGGANNAITANLTDSMGNNIAQTAGLHIYLKLAHTLQIGANTFALNGATAVSIVSHRNTANNIATGYSSGGIIELMFDGTAYEDMSQ